MKQISEQLSEKTRKIINFLGFQAGWFSCVLGAAHGVPALGPVVVAVLVVVHLLLSEEKVGEVVLAVSAAFCGVVVDSALAYAGVFSFAEPLEREWLTPPWLVAMWVNLAITFNSSLSWLKPRLVLAGVLGAVGGPLAYYTGQGFGALAFEYPLVELQEIRFTLTLPLTIASLFVVWGLVTPGLLQIARLVGEQPPEPDEVPSPEEVYPGLMMPGMAKGMPPGGVPYPPTGPQNVPKKTGDGETGKTAAKDAEGAEEGKEGTE